MKCLAVAALCLIALTTTASAQRASSTRMSCGAATAYVQAQGAVVIGTGGESFERVVRDQSFCPKGMEPKPLFAPTTDNRACMIGYYCFDYPAPDR